VKTREKKKRRNLAQKKIQSYVERAAGNCHLDEGEKKAVTGRILGSIRHDHVVETNPARNEEQKSWRPEGTKKSLSEILHGREGKVANSSLKQALGGGGLGGVCARKEEFVQLFKFWGMKKKVRGGKKKEMGKLKQTRKKETQGRNAS